MLVLGGQAQGFVREAVLQSDHFGAKLRQLRYEPFQPVWMPYASLRILYIHGSLPLDVEQNKRRANPKG